jgi:hypothetical protein
LLQKKLAAIKLYTACPVCITATGYNHYILPPKIITTMKSLPIIATLLVLVIGNSHAQANRSLKDERQQIQQGIASGQLTRAEAQRLTQQTAQLRRQAVQYKRNDGVVSATERADLRRDNRQLNRRICKQKHDRQRRIR